MADIRPHSEAFFTEPPGVVVRHLKAIAGQAGTIPGLEKYVLAQVMRLRYA
ncbi:MAG: hypothetical protein ABGZ23_20445 [Fuerstiella sp.]